MGEALIQSNPDSPTAITIGTLHDLLTNITGALGGFAQARAALAASEAKIPCNTGAGSASVALEGEGAAESGVWSLAPKPRGLAIESQLGGNLPANFRTIDRFENGVATSIKSIDLKAVSYQEAQQLTSTLNGYIDSLAGWTGQATPYAGVVIQPGQVATRTLQIAIPPGGMSPVQQAVFNSAAQRARGLGLNFIVTEFP